MFCPECGSKLEKGYCPHCHKQYLDVPASTRMCPKCRGDMVLVGERTMGLLLFSVGVKSKIYRCTSCGYELSERDLKNLRSDKEFQQAKKDLKDEMKNKVKKFVKK